MTDYQAPPPEVAEFVHEKNLECEEQRQRLGGASADVAWAIANDTRHGRDATEQISDSRLTSPYWPFAVTMRRQARPASSRCQTVS